MLEELLGEFLPDLTDSILDQGPSGPDWILKNNFWDDSGIWIDSATWND